ncbi:tetratricopeptide repeat protein [Candidatus Woesearchaeota archaeon]|nr:tetratricopeptide repeat protein [Candidatus Woesearchaeota archaeon]
MERKRCPELYNKAKELYIKKEYKKALEIFSSIDVKCVGNFDESVVHHYAGLCYSNLYKLKKSIREFDLAIRYRPNYPKIYLDKGLTYYFYYNRNRAREFFLRLFGRKNILEKALKCFQEGLLVDQNSAEIWYYRGRVLELLGKRGKAEKSFRNAIKHERRIKNTEKSALFRKVRKRVS